MKKMRANSATRNLELNAFKVVLLALALTQAWAGQVHYTGTATLCFVGAVPPVIERTADNDIRSVSGLVSLYFIRTAPVGLEPPAGLVNGWELLTSDMTISGKSYRLDWTGIFTPEAHAKTSGTTLRETASIETPDLSIISGSWQGTGSLAGTQVDYVLSVIPDAAPDCPETPPPQCSDIDGGCLPAEPPAVQGPVVYSLSGVVN